MNQNNKRAAIVQIAFYPIIESIVIVHHPGQPTIDIKGANYTFRPQSAEFKETAIHGDEVSQQFSAIITDISKMSNVGIRRILSLPGVLVLTYSNDEQRVVGTDQFPVQLTIEESGRPAQFKLSFKRSSPEPAKFLQSF